MTLEKFKYILTDCHIKLDLVGPAAEDLYEASNISLVSENTSQIVLARKFCNLDKVEDISTRVNSTAGIVKRFRSTDEIFAVFNRFGIPPQLLQELLFQNIITFKE